MKCGAADEGMEARGGQLRDCGAGESTGLERFVFQTHGALGAATAVQS